MKYMLFSWPDDPWYGSNPIWGLHDTLDEAIDAAIKWIGEHRYVGNYTLVSTKVVRNPDVNTLKKWIDSRGRIDVRDPDTGNLAAAVMDDDTRKYPDKMWRTIVVASVDALKEIDDDYAA